MDFVLSNTMKLDFEGYMITVPTPEAYVLQKMIINHKRGLKKEADQEKIARLVPYIDKGRFVNTYNADALLQVSVSANRKVFERVKRKDPIMCEALKELMKDEKMIKELLAGNDKKK